MECGPDINATLHAVDPVGQKNGKTNNSRALTRYTFRIAVVVIGILYLGLEMEQWSVNRLPDSSYLYETDEVCGLYLPSQYSSEFLSKSIFATFERIIPQNDTDTSVTKGRETVPEVDDTAQDQSYEYAPLASATHASADVVRWNDGIVQHCGSCGQCSNPHDISIYDETRNTLFRSTLQCSMNAILRGRNLVSDCLQRTVGFTDGCNDCWVENIMCDARHCLFTCAWTALVSSIQTQGSNEDAPQQLNACLQCDEKRCGPAFLQCAGANRRRAGILSDIRRDPNEVCDSVDEEWWKSDSLQSYYKLAHPKTMSPTPVNSNTQHPTNLRHYAAG